MSYATCLYRNRINSELPYKLGSVYFELYESAYILFFIYGNFIVDRLFDAHDESKLELFLLLMLINGRHRAITHEYS